VQDLKDALESLAEALRHNLKVMSSFDKYKQEVLSGTSEWTPMHKDPVFWRENVMHFEDNEFQVKLDTALPAAPHGTFFRDLALAVFRGTVPGFGRSREQ